MGKNIERARVRADERRRQLKNELLNVELLPHQWTRVLSVLDQAAGHGPDPLYSDRLRDIMAGIELQLRGGTR